MLVSGCLTGQRVRYDGGHKLDEAAKSGLGGLFEVVSFCPENDSGMGTPREPCVLRGDPEAPMMVGTVTGADCSDRIRGWAEEFLSSQGALCGAVLKARSPSCGLEVGLADSQGTARGLFAALCLRREPQLPLIDEEGLQDEAARAGFAAAVWRRFDELKGERA